MALMGHGRRVSRANQGPLPHKRRALAHPPTRPPAVVGTGPAHSPRPRSPPSANAHRWHRPVNHGGGEAPCGASVGVMSESTPKPDEARFFRRALVAVILLPVLVLGGCTAALIFGPKDTAGNAEAAAITQCRDAVRAQLKAPATAKFGGESVTAGKVVGYVDSQNSYGAQVRTRFACEGGKATLS